MADAPNSLLSQKAKQLQTMTHIKLHESFC